ncbi:ligand-binding sensor domain-containing protein [Haliscomenobacter sp.]|uniref:ligand-binding sensor domain-containing protein n=1 Tax=Haliscomenobacter sp. TaxID=2717303 RepID=UPI003BA88E9D
MFKFYCQLPVQRFSLLMFLCLSLTLNAQQGDIPFRYFSLRDGLADWTITSLQKDPSGLLWIGTAHGLQRFDGYKFLTFNTNPNNRYSISDHHVQAIRLLQDSLLLVVYLRNNELFDLIDYKNFRRKTILLKKSGIRSNEQVQGIRADEDGNVLVITRYQTDTHKMYALYEFDIVRNRFIRIVEVKSDFSGEPNDQLFDAIKVGKNAWIFGNNKDGVLNLVSRQGLIKQFKQFDFEGATLPANVFNERISILKRDRSGQVWLAFARNHYLFKYNSQKKTFKAVNGLPEDGEFSLWWQDKKGNVLVSETDGNLRFPITKKLYCIQKNGRVEDFSKFTSVSKQIIDVYSDDFYGTLFFGVDTGLKVFKNNQGIVQQYLQKNIAEDDFGRILRGMASDRRGNIFFANENSFWYSLNKNDLQKGMDTLRIIEEKTDTVLRFNCCFDLKYQEPNYLWGIACQGRDKGLLIRYNLSTKRATIYRYPARFRVFTVDADGQFWLLTEYPNGDYKLLIFNRETAEFRQFATQEDPAPLNNIFPYYITSSKNNTFWIATNKGLYKIVAGKTLRDNHFETYLDRTQLGSQLIYCVYEDKQGILWLGSSQGLIRFDPKTLKSKYYTQKEGLASNTISGILEDHLGNLWISTHNGLSCFDRKGGTFTNFYDLDGFSHSSFTRYSFFRDEDNILYFGTINGVNAFRPERLLRRDTIPQVSLTRVSKYNWVEDTLSNITHDLQQLRYLELRAYEQDLELEFTLPVYWNVDKIKYRYKLEGLDPDWVDLGGLNQIKYNQLPAGRYRLRIQGADPRGNWSQSLVLEVRVFTYVYKYWWFWALLALALGVGVYYALRSRLVHKLKIERLRTKIAADIHDEVSGLLAGIAMQAEVLQHLGTNSVDAGKLNKIAEIARKAMSRLHDVIWSIDSRKDHIEDLLFRMQEHANDVLSPLNVQYQVTLKNLDLKTGIPIQIRQDLYYIFKEAINNVAKHAKASQVNIRLGHQGRFFEMEIANDGPIPEITPKASSGNGLQNMKMRAQRIGAEIRFIQDAEYRVVLRMRRL